ncbi:MAG TPA: cysteine peptidase family C39 domain-containing protein [Gammaproteobacteria bacterium]|nr:cysteine peptidase family C39 domain-containing protein [Gammaproteobacteria bacterium]
MAHFYKTTSILQYGETECGLACLAILFDYYGLNLPLARLRDFAGVSRDGTRASTLLSLARAQGFEAEAYSLELEALTALPGPVILHWNFSHYIVLEGIKNKKVYINDPAIGRTVVSFDELNTSFTGVAIALTPSALITNQHQQKPKSDLLRLFKLTMPFQTVMITTLLLVSALSFFYAGMSSVFVNHILLQHEVQWLKPVLLLTAGVSLLLLIMSQTKEWLQNKACVCLSLAEASRLFIHVMQWPAKMYALRPKGELLAVLNQLDFSLLRLLSGFGVISSSVITSLMIVMGLSLFNVKFALQSLGFCLFSLVVVIVLGRCKQGAEKLASQAEAHWFSATLSAFNHLESLNIAGLQSIVFSQWSNLLHEKIQRQQVLAYYQALIAAFTKTSQMGLPFLILIMGAHQYDAGKLSLGALLAFSSLNALLNRQLSTLFEAIKSTQSAAAALDRVHDVYAVKQDPRFALPAVSLSSASPLELKVNHLTFYYNKTSEPVLKGITLNIQPGAHIAFVGGSGSGKSTLGKLLSGLYLPDEGDITWGGVSLAAMSPELISACIATVMQESTLMTGSLLQNISLWNDQVAMESVHRLLKHVCLEGFIQARGLLLPLNANSSNISGGEKQRLALARALIQNTPLLILDEATSSLDEATESNIIHYLKTVNKTVIHIAHRLSTIKHCEQIHVLDQGEVIESGTYAELIAKNGHFYRLVQAEIREEAAIAQVA